MNPQNSKCEFGRNLERTLRELGFREPVLSDLMHTYSVADGRQAPQALYKGGKIRAIFEMFAKIGNPASDPSVSTLGALVKGAKIVSEATDREILVTGECDLQISYNLERSERLRAHLKEEALRKRRQENYRLKKERMEEQKNEKHSRLPMYKVV